MDEELKQEIFRFLDNLRDSGIINMYGAAEYVESYGLSKLEAQDIHKEWIRTFSERHKENKV